jgi:hypothetical protein
MFDESVKKPYTKPVVVSHGSVEKITLKSFGASDAMLFESGVSGSSVS